MSQEIFMEDVQSIGLEAMKLIEERLKVHGVELTPEQGDSLYVPMIETIEKVVGCPDYRHHN